MNQILKTTMRTLLVSFAIFSLISCNSKEKKTELAAPPTQEVITETEPSTAPQIGSRVPNDWVCMVNDAYMGKAQIPVQVNGITYYGCCEMCVKTLNEKEEARTAIDPYSQQKVDKAEAFIVLTGVHGEVAYFESEANFLMFEERSRMNH